MPVESYHRWGCNAGGVISLMGVIMLVESYHRWGHNAGGVISPVGS